MNTYEQKYKEALKVIGSLYNVVKYLSSSDALLTSQTIEKAFPELKESEDEKNIKNLVEELKCSLRAANCQNDATKGGHEKRIALLEWGIAWLEKQGEKTIPEDVNEAALQYVDTCPVDGRVTHDNINEPYWNNHSMMDAYKAGWLEKQGEQKPIDKVESKFKDGDVLYHKSPLTGIEYFVMSRGVNRCGNIDSYFRYNSEDGFGINIPSVLSGKLDDITPATKEQRDLLFQKMKEAGYEWDAEKKELRKIEQKPDFCHHEVDLSNCSEEYRKAYYDGWNNCNQQHAQLEAEQNPAWSEEDEERLQDVIYWFEIFCVKNQTKPEMKESLDWLKSLKDRVQPQPKQEWSEYDKIQLSEAIQMIEANGTWIRSEDAVKKVSNWLKSLKPNHWKPSGEQMQALFEAKLASINNREYFLGLLYEDLKKF